MICLIVNFNNKIINMKKKELKEFLEIQKNIYKKICKIINYGEGDIEDSEIID